MKIRLLSDLHTEGGFARNLLKTQGEDVLVLAGDIAVGSRNVWEMITMFAEEQPNIVFTYGNHEFYHQNYQQVCNELNTYALNTSVKILNPGVTCYDPTSNTLVDYSPTMPEDHIAIIGAPLWTNFRYNELSKLHAKDGINDFRLISYQGEYYENRPFTPNDAAYMFEHQYGYIKLMTNAIKNKKLIVTHFLPATECIDKQYLGQDSRTSTLNDYFANNLGDWISYQDDTTWVHGHTHSNVDITIGTTRIVANPYGYGYNGFYKECLIDI